MRRGVVVTFCVFLFICCFLAASVQSSVITGEVDTVTDPPQPPIVSFTASPISGDAPLTVEFNDTSPGNPTLRCWCSGEYPALVCPSDLLKRNFTYHYYTPGIYYSILIEANSGGYNGSSLTIQVKGATPTIVAIRPIRHRHGGNSFIAVINGTGFQKGVVEDVFSRVVNGIVVRRYESIPSVVLWRATPLKNITASSVTVQSGSGLTARLKIPKDTKQGRYNVTLFNPDGQNATLLHGFKILT